MTPPLPKELESQKIAGVLSNIFNQMQMESKDLVEKIVQAIAPAFVSVTINQVELYSKAVGSRNEDEKINADLENKVKNLGEKTERVSEDLKEMSKEFRKTASSEIVQQFPQLNTPASSTNK